MSVPGVDWGWYEVRPGRFASAFTSPPGFEFIANPNGKWTALYRHPALYGRSTEREITEFGEFDTPNEAKRAIGEAFMEGMARWVPPWEKPAMGLFP